MKNGKRINKFDAHLSRGLELTFGCFIAKAGSQHSSVALHLLNGLHQGQCTVVSLLATALLEGGA